MAMNFAELDDTYYYVMSSQDNKEFAEDNGYDLMMKYIVGQYGYPVREIAVVVEPGYSKNKLLMFWEFGVIGEVKIEREHDA